ncbi:MAG TPA: hypothetical protein VFW87_14650 [Pirellulales bacterium]|nr:hypothetical protein [Pirellulales bacterium]
MQTSAEWNLDASRAALRLGSFSASVNLSAPQRGVHQVKLAAQPLECEALGVKLESAGQGAPPALIDAYPRGGDLVAAYAQGPSSLVSTQIYWRAALLEFDGESCPTIDLQVSVQTSLLESRPALSTRSCLPACEVVSAALGPPVQARSREPGAHCLVFRPSAWNESYVEMVHPSDAVASEVATKASTMEIAHRLFEHELEKGVILRARVRGMFVPRRGDTELALAAWRQFVAQAPPLTT